MKIFLMLMLCAAPAAAEWGRSENAAAASLASARAEIEIIGGAPLLDLLAARDAASLPVEIAGEKFLATAVFDSEWNIWFSLKPAAGGKAGAWNDGMLAKGVLYRYKGLEIKISKSGDAVSMEAAGAVTETTMTALFDSLYEGSVRFAFGGMVTYAVFRNVAPLSEQQGTVSLRVGSDGLYYFSLTPDSAIESYPRWLLAINGVLYGLRIDSGSLLFVSKEIEMGKTFAARERRVR